MPAEFRAARASEYAKVRELIGASFSEDEADLWDYIAENDQSLQPEGVRLAVVDGRPVACTVALPRRVRGRTGWLRGAVITLVCCHPDFRLQGHGGSTVRDALSWVTAQGAAVSILFGVPAFYPRFGFVPVLPRLETKLAADAVPDWGGALEPLSPAGLTVATRLFDKHLAGYVLAVARDPQWWQWRLRQPSRREVLVLAGGNGYAVVGPGMEPGTLAVTECAAACPPAARRLLSGLAARARGQALATLKLLEPADHLMTRLALVCGAQQFLQPAAAGMALVNSWPRVLPAGYHVSPEGDGLQYQGRLVLRADHTALVQLALGYRSLDDLLLLPGCELASVVGGGAAARADPAARAGGAAGAADAGALRRDFPPRAPCWHLAPYW